MDNSTVLLPYDLIETCESSLASELSNPQALSVSAIAGNSARPQLFAGIDFARKNHLTVCWILERLPSHLALALNLNPNLPPFPSLAPIRGPRFATRTSLEGNQNCGGLGKPLGQGEGFKSETINQKFG